MGAEALLQKLIAAGISLTVRGEALVASPRNRLTVELRVQIRAHKADLIQVLQRQEAISLANLAATDPPHLPHLWYRKTTPETAAVMIRPFSGALRSAYIQCYTRERGRELGARLRELVEAGAHGSFTEEFSQARLTMSSQRWRANPSSRHCASWLRRAPGQGAGESARDGQSVRRAIRGGST
jgi:hypothetical protein